MLVHAGANLKFIWARINTVEGKCHRRDMTWQMMLSKGKNAGLRLGIRPVVAGAALLFGFSDFAFSHWLLDLHLPINLDCIAQATIVALGAGFALWLILRGINERRKMLEDELCRCAELNHTRSPYVAKKGHSRKTFTLRGFPGTTPRNGYNSGFPSSKGNFSLMKGANWL